MCPWLCYNSALFSFHVVIYIDTMYFIWLLTRLLTVTSFFPYIMKGCSTFSQNITIIFACLPAFLYVSSMKYLSRWYALLISDVKNCYLTHEFVSPTYKVETDVYQRRHDSDSHIFVKYNNNKKSTSSEM